MSIYIIDCCTIVLDVVAHELKKISPSLNVITFNDADFFVSFCSTAKAPKLIITDINWTQYSGKDWIRKLSTMFPHIPILIYSNSAVPEDIFPAKPKSSPYLFFSVTSKITTLDDFIFRLKKILTSNKIIIFSDDSKIEAKKNNDAKISKRQKQIINLLNRGYSSENIAIQLAIKPQTLKIHLFRLYKKINVSSRTEALFYFKSKNLIAN
jgi:DNA-binding NarL/FixJ family response regulator